MSQTLEAPRADLEATLDPRQESIDREIQQFSYRPVPLLAIIGLVLGLLAVMALLGIVGIVLALLGIVTSLAATLKIAFDREAYGGLKLAVAGLTLSTAFFAGGVYNQIDLYRREVPAGYRRISFPHDISAKEFVQTNEGVDLHPDVEELLGQPIFLKAWIFPTDEKRDLRTFLIVKDNGLCCFGKQPERQDSIIVHLDPAAFPEGFDYTSGMVSMAGTLDIHPDAQELWATGNTIYVFRAAYFEKSWTMF
jgi:hypothetical protein